MLHKAAFGAVMSSSVCRRLATHSSRPLFAPPLRREPRSVLSKHGALAARTFFGLAEEDDDSHHDHFIRMPNVMDAKQGTILAWVKKEGDKFNQGDTLCEVDLGSVTVAVDAIQSGVISEIVVRENCVVKVDEPIATYVNNMNEYLNFVEEQRIHQYENEKKTELREIIDGPDEAKIPEDLANVRMMKDVRLIIKDKLIEDETVAKIVQTLARKGHKELAAAYKASFDGEAFDRDFFVATAVDIAREHEEMTNK